MSPCESALRGTAIRVSLTSGTERAQRHQEHGSRWLKGWHCQKGADLSVSRSYRELDFSHVRENIITLSIV